MTRPRPQLAALLAAPHRRPTPPPSPYTVATDGFEGNLYWQYSAPGADPVCALSAAQHHSGAQSLHLATTTTGAAPGDAMVAFRLWPWVETHLMTQDAWIYLPDPAKLGILWWWAQLNDNIEWWHPHIAWDMATGGGYYWDDTGSPIHVGDLDHVWAAATWTHLVFRIDIQAKCYVSAAIGTDLADLSGLPFQQQTGAAPHNFQAEFGMQTSGAAAAHAYLDDLTITATRP